MSLAHKLDKAKVEEFLNEKGWRRGPHHEWVTPLNMTNSKIEEQWTEAILQGIVCVLEIKKQATEKFIKEHPTARR